MTRTLPVWRLTHVRIVGASLMVGPAGFAVESEASSPGSRVFGRTHPRQVTSTSARPVARHLSGI